MSSASRHHRARHAVQAAAAAAVVVATVAMSGVALSSAIPRDRSIELDQIAPAPEATRGIATDGTHPSGVVPSGPSARVTALRQVDSAVSAEIGWLIASGAIGNPSPRLRTMVEQFTPDLSAAAVDERVDRLRLLIEATRGAAGALADVAPDLDRARQLVSALVAVPAEAARGDREVVILPVEQMVQAIDQIRASILTAQSGVPVGKNERTSSSDGSPDAAIVGGIAGALVMATIAAAVLMARRRRHVPASADIARPSGLAPERLEAVLAAGRRLSIRLDMEATAAVVVSDAVQITGASWAALVVDTDGAPLLAALNGTSALSEQELLRIAGHCAETGINARIDVFGLDIIATPLVADRRLLGAIVVGSARPLDASADDGLGLLAVQAGPAVATALAHGAAEAAAGLDALTGLANRRSLDADLESQFASSRRSGDPFAVVMVDIDHFKAVNDTFGHGVGDQVLRSVADAVASVLRDTDRVYRYGGEELCVVCRGATAQVASEIAQRVRMAMVGVILPDGRQLTISAGVASTDDGFDTLADLLASADLGLYEAKRAGRDGVVVVGRVSPRGGRPDGATAPSSELARPTGPPMVGHTLGVPGSEGDS